MLQEDVTNETDEAAILNYLRDFERNRPSKSRALCPPVQSGARGDGTAGIDGNPGIVKSVTYRF